MFLNKIFLIGNLTRDPELKALPSGSKVASFSLATNRKYKHQDSTLKEEVEYHNIVAFGKQAETIAQYMRKGSSILIEGRIQTRSWDGQDGKKNYRTEIIADQFQFGPSPKNFQNGNGGAYVPPQRTPGLNTETRAGQDPIFDGLDSPAADVDPIEYPDEEINLEDIPF